MSSNMSLPVTGSAILWLHRCFLQMGATVYRLHYTEICGMRRLGMDFVIKNLTGHMVIDVSRQGLVRLRFYRMEFDSTYGYSGRLTLKLPHAFLPTTRPNASAMVDDLTQCVAYLKRAIDNMITRNEFVLGDSPALHGESEE